MWDRSDAKRAKVKPSAEEQPKSQQDGQVNRKRGGAPMLSELFVPSRRDYRHAAPLPDAHEPPPLHTPKKNEEEILSVPGPWW